MFKAYVYLCVFALLPVSLAGSNLKMNGDVVSVSGDVAIVELSLSWDNSWRNVYNYDAAYIFGKYRLSPELRWFHAVLSECEALTGGYGVYKTGQGFFVFRTEEGQGHAEVKLRLHWNLAGNPERVVEGDNVLNKRVHISFEGIEMVLVPSAPFFAGDGVSEGGFTSSTWGGIPAEYDLIGTNGNFAYTASSNAGTASQVADRQNWATHDAGKDWTAVVPAWWQVDFKTPKEILYFGVSGEYNRPAIPARSVPDSTWYLEGSEDATNWVELWSGDEADWSTSYVSYPVQHAIKVKNPGAYRYYRIRVTHVERSEFWNTVHINNVAMTETDLGALQENTVVVDAQEHNLPVNFPNGYDGFFAMKSEITQEQYVSFLNKQDRNSQMTRTVGERLAAIREGEYIFGDNRQQPSFRNGIVLMKLGQNSGMPNVFACDLNPGDMPNSLDDGQTVACNYLSPADLLAYADWAGLRPLSELEYEKMCRRAFPAQVIAGEFAWNSTSASFGKTLNDAGKETEYYGEGNVNAGNHSGPVRPGAFLRSGKNREQAGISFWGVENLSGNLAEIYYNADVYGRQLDGSVHGDGELGSEGDTDVSATLWSRDTLAFGVRGGSYQSERNGLAISDRSKAAGYFKTWRDRKPDVSFRLGYSFPQEEHLSVLTLENGLEAGNSLVYDTICDGANYQITGNEPVADEPVIYTWYVSKDRGQTWMWLEGQTGKDLVLKNMVGEVPFSTAAEMRYKRYSSTASGSGISGTVALVVGHGFTINQISDTLIPCREIEGFEVSTPLPSYFEWKLVDKGKTLQAVEEDAFHSVCKPVTNDFKEGDKWPSGIYTIDLTVKNRSKGCRHSQRLEVLALPRTIDPFAGIANSYMYKNGFYLLAHRWTGSDPQHWELLEDECGKVIINDSTGFITYNSTVIDFDQVECHFTASLVCREVPDKVYTKRAKYMHRSCKDYYDSGMRENGVYMIDPDGPGGVAPYEVTCDMTNGGWTKFADISNGWHGFPGHSANHYKNRVTNHDRFVALASISDQQKITGVQGASESCCDAYYFLNYGNGCVSGLPCGSKGNGNWGNVIVNINKAWGNAMYKTRYTTDGSVNSGGGTYFVEMWFK